MDAPLAGGKHAPNEDAPSSDDEEELQDALQSDESDEEALGEDDGDVMAQLDALMSGSSGGDEDEGKRACCGTPFVLMSVDYSNSIHWC